MLWKETLDNRIFKESSVLVEKRSGKSDGQ